MNRRELITLLGGASVWPLAVRAQQQPAMPVIGYLSALSEAQVAAQLTAFHRGLNEVGFMEGQNVVMRRASGGHVASRIDAPWRNCPARYRHAVTRSSEMLRGEH
jgi:hypothetical protein